MNTERGREVHGKAEHAREALIELAPDFLQIGRSLVIAAIAFALTVTAVAVAVAIAALAALAAPTGVVK